MSEGRTPPETVYANNSNPNVDAISGPTPPFGFPDQGWGGGDRPAITMTHYAAETFCQWLSKKTGKTYRLPTRRNGNMRHVAARKRLISLRAIQKISPIKASGVNFSTQRLIV